MSIVKKTIAIYSNLPSGGAKEVYNLIKKFINNKYYIKEIIEPDYKISNFFQYLYTALVTSQVYQRKAICETNHDLLIVNHSWLVKSPSIIRYTNKPKIYLCHETMREYYDPEHKRNQNLKEIIINFLRLPLKYLDKINMSSPNTTIVANSNYSKKLIDKTYNVNCKVIYPGINTRIYHKNKYHIHKQNQVICVSAINKLKRQDFFIDVLSQIPSKSRPRLVLISNGANSQYLKYIISKAKNLHVKIKIMLNVTESKKIRELHKSKVFIYCPINEPFGIVIEEAMAAGLPLLVYGKGGGYSEILGSKNGIILNTLEALEWGQKLESLLLNEKTRVKFSKYNEQYAEDYLDSEVMSRKLVKIIDSLI